VQALVWYSENESIKQIAKLIGVCEKTIITWLKTFMCKGIAWLTGIPYQGSGRKDKLTKEQKQELVKNLRQSRRLVNVNRSKRVNLCTT
jgi:transposase